MENLKSLGSSSVRSKNFLQKCLMGPGRINKVVEHVDCITQHDGGRIYFFQVRIIGKVSYFNIIYLVGSYLIVCWYHRPEPRVRFHCQAGRGLHLWRSLWQPVASTSPATVADPVTVISSQWPSVAEDRSVAADLTVSSETETRTCRILDRGNLSQFSLVPPRQQ